MEEHEFCPNCQADLTMQKGYHNDFPYWVCKGCGEMLINPEVEGNIAWICDGCGEMLNIQPGFSEDCGIWKCKKCGYANEIDVSELYLSGDEYLQDRNRIYKGLSDEEVLKLSCYEEERMLGEKGNVCLVRDKETGERFVKILLGIYDKSVYDYMLKHPIPYMPRIKEVYESKNALIVIEEYIPGKTLQEMLEEHVLSPGEAVRITIKLCEILDRLHSLPKPIVHRDVKPLNIIVHEGDVYLLDMNVAKWIDESKTVDTRLLGSMLFAAPEQAGYGLTASVAKTDIYAVGVTLNLMLTGEFPQQKKAEGALWPIIERCIRMESKERYTARELIEELSNVKETDG
ncbi:MAG: serine/threonine protein kinase [Lachnospiraceae bacterium]|nr:serine/threonine protein kinase [Lachnospiraceae bacterium]